MLRLNRSLRWLGLVVCLTAGTAAAEGPENAPHAGAAGRPGHGGPSPGAKPRGPEGSGPRGPAAGGSASSRPVRFPIGESGGRPQLPPGLGSARVHPPGSGSGAPALPTNERFKERIERMRERARENRERREKARELSRELSAKLHDDKVDPAELRDKYQKLQELRVERRSEQRGQLRRRYGEALRKPEVKGELELHARRIAELHRLQFLVASERKGADRKKLLTRADQLLEQEEKRHAASMQRWERPEASPAPSALPAGSAAAPIQGAP